MSKCCVASIERVTVTYSIELLAEENVKREEEEEEEEEIIEDSDFERIIGDTSTS